jgi:hypothetical protein
MRDREEDLAVEVKPSAQNCEEAITVAGGVVSGKRGGGEKVGKCLVGGLEELVVIESVAE